MKCFETLSFWLRESLNFQVWTYSIIRRCHYKCNKRNLSSIKAMLCRIRNYFLFMEHISSYFDALGFVCYWCSQLYQSGHKPSVDACQSLSIGSGYSMMFFMHCLQINVCKTARFWWSSVLRVSGINRELFLYFWFS